MASKRATAPARQLVNGLFSSQHAAPSATPSFTRSMATEAPLPEVILNQAFFQPQQNPFLASAQCTLYNFPSLEPVRFASYPSTHLLLPLRRDLLHKAVIYEADARRSGTASTKWRSEIHGSGRKIRPQKGTGSARLGDKKSPMLRGGGVAFGPKPRDFSTDLPKKIYDLAWRTALSYRYRKGELIVTDSEIEIEDVAEGSLERFVRDVLEWNRFGKGGGNTLFVTEKRREGLFSALEGERNRQQARAVEVGAVDVKDLLDGGRVVIERTSLRWMLEEHESDLAPRQKMRAWESMMDFNGFRRGEVAEA